MLPAELNAPQLHLQGAQRGVYWIGRLAAALNGVLRPSGSVPREFAAFLAIDRMKGPRIGEVKPWRGSAERQIQTLKYLVRA